MFRIEHHTPFYTPLFTMKYDDKKKIKDTQSVNGQSFGVGKRKQRSCS